MIRTSIILMLFLFVYQTYGSSISEIPQVPSHMEFAGMKLKITEHARKEIQDHVNKLRASDKYFKIKLDRVNLFFPIIEKVFKDANLPDDFKYLSIQESALISDAVSSANAVGFWQFKSFTGREVGLRIDNQVDERLNIVASSYGAAKYMKTNNFYYNNWIYALTAYNTGRGGARKFVDESQYGVKKMTIDKNTHWYVKTFLAHKIAFENEIGGSHSKGLELLEYKKAGGKSLSKIAKEFEVDLELLKDYNKWLKRGSVPTDKDYIVIIPVQGKLPKGTKDLIAEKNEPKDDAPKSKDVHDEVSYPKMLKEGLEYASEIYVSINGIDAILAHGGDSPSSLAAKGSIPVHKFMKYNDLEDGQYIYAGDFYYLSAKRNKGKIAFHITKPDDSWWKISQIYGVKMRKVLALNRENGEEEPKTGRLVWLTKKRPKQYPIQIITLSEEDLKPEENIEEITTNKKIVSPGSDSTEMVTTDSTDLDNDLPEILEEPMDSIIFDPDLHQIHTVIKGENLYRIAKNYKMDIDSLIMLNDIDPYNMTIEIDQKLKVKKLVELVDSTMIKPIEVATKLDSVSVDSVSVESIEQLVEMVHEVVPGETLYGISKKYMVTVEKILEWNGLNLEDGLNIGQKLTIKEENNDVTSDSTSISKNEVTLDKPTPADDNTNQIDKPTTHTVAAGDTLYSIATKYGITVEEILDLNEKKSADLSIGEVLKIK